MNQCQEKVLGIGLNNHKIEEVSIKILGIVSSRFS